MLACSSYPCCSLLDDSSTLPPASPRGTGRSKQSHTLPIGPEPDITHSILMDMKLSLDLNQNACKKASEQQATRSLMSEDRRRIWVHGPRPEYKKNSQRYNLPSRMTGLLRPNLDVVILPGGHVPTTEFWQFNREVLGLKEWQVRSSACALSFWTARGNDKARLSIALAILPSQLQCDYMRSSWRSFITLTKLLCSCGCVT
jgi:hypothetical protein